MPEGVAHVKAHASATGILDDRLTEFKREGNSTADQFAKEDAALRRSSESDARGLGGRHQIARQAWLFSGRTFDLHGER